jgi:hypothetical protein
MVVASTVQVFLRTTFSEGLSLEHFAIAGDARQSAGAFVMTYSAQIGIAFAVAALATCSCAFLVRKLVPAFGWKSCAVPLLGAAAVATMIWRTDDAQAGFPSPYRILALGAMLEMQTPLYAGDRDPVPADMIRRRQSDANFVFLIVDESVSADFLNIDGFELPTTPYLSSAKSDYVNLGKASSAGNISGLSNILLQSGLRVDQLPDPNQVALRTANIFQYAKKAGYWTVYMDAQALRKSWVNYMRDADLKTIDAVYRVSDQKEDEPLYQRDRFMLSLIPEIMYRHEKVFFYILKAGTHFPYEGTYPPDQRIFSPTMAPGSSLADSTVPEIWGSYENGVRWSVDGFLKEFVKKIDLESSVVIYTGDHGQSIEHGGLGVGTHGKVMAPPRSQATVPLLVFGPPAESRLRPVLPEVFDRASHFQVFPSLLIMMGYPEDEVIKRFGQPLWVPETGAREFLSGDLFLRGRAFLNRFD